MTGMTNEVIDTITISYSSPEFSVADLPLTLKETSTNSLIFSNEVITKFYDLPPAKPTISIFRIEVIHISPTPVELDSSVDTVYVLLITEGGYSRYMSGKLLAVEQGEDISLIPDVENYTIISLGTGTHPIAITH